MNRNELPKEPYWDGPLSHPFYSKVVKRILDLLLALILLIPGLILMIPLAVWVKLDSPGPVFYRAVRGGYHNQPFRIFKFRSMVVDADKTGGCTAKNDDRVTRAGRIMRRLKMDELPQLFNIIKGDMSLRNSIRRNSNASCGCGRASRTGAASYISRRTRSSAKRIRSRTLNG